jgi:hypothetical protein
VTAAPNQCVVVGAKSLSTDADTANERCVRLGGADDGPGVHLRC